MNSFDISEPMKVLHSKGLLVDNVLDYCSPFKMDAEFLSLTSFNHDYALADKFNTVTCNYVLNNDMSNLEIINTLVNVMGFLSETGNAYFTAESPLLEADVLNMELIHQCNKFAIYHKKAESHGTSND